MQAQGTPAGKYESAQQQRLLGLIKTLAGHEIEGLAPAEIARRNDCAPSQVTRDLDNLRLAGFAEQLPGRAAWRLGPALVQIAMAHTDGLARAERRLGETKQRFSRAG